MSIVQNDTSPIDFFMADSTDTTGETGKTGLTAGGITFKLAKAGGNFAVGTGSITQKTGANIGWWQYTPVAGDVGTLGEIAFEATATGCFSWRDKDRVVQAGAAASDWTGTRAAKIDTIDTNAAAIKAKTDNLPTDPADESLIIAATDAINTAIGNVPANVRINLATELARIDATISSRALASGATLTSGERAAVAAAILAAVIETNGATTLTVQDSLQLLAALTGGKVSGIVAGTGAQTFTVRSATDLQTIATVTGDDLGNRSAIVLTIP